MRRGCGRGVYGKDKTDGVRELDQTMTGVAKGHGVSGLTGLEWWQGGG